METIKLEEANAIIRETLERVEPQFGASVFYTAICPESENQEAVVLGGEDMLARMISNVLIANSGRLSTAFMAAIMTWFETALAQEGSENKLKLELFLSLLTERIKKKEDSEPLIYKVSQN